MVQWLGLPAFTAEGLGSIPGRGTKILQATGSKAKKRKKNVKFEMTIHHPIGDAE